MEYLSKQELINAKVDKIKEDVIKTKSYLKHEEKLYKGVGSKISNDMTTDEMLKVAKLDWGVATSVIRYGECLEHISSKAKAIYREDTGELLSTTKGENWKPFQNGEVINEFRKFCDEGSLELERIGELDGGKIIFASAIMNESFDVMAAGDVITGRLILTNGHECGRGLNISLNTIRLICTNGMARTVKSGSKTISHLKSFKEINIQEILRSSRNNFVEAAAIATSLAEVEISSEDAFEILVSAPSLKGIDGKDLEKQPKIIQKAFEKFANNTAIGSELESSNHTAWGLLNSVTEYVNHNQQKVSEASINSLWLGAKAQQQNSFETHLISSIDFANRKVIDKRNQKTGQQVRAW